MARAHVWRDIPGRKDEDKIWTIDKQPVLYLEDLHEDPTDSIEKLIGVWGGWLEKGLEFYRRLDGVRSLSEIVELIKGRFEV
jgi:hypothetical protein